MTAAPELIDCISSDVSREVFNSDKPLLLKGLVNSWPVTTIGGNDPTGEKTGEYLKQFYNGDPVTVYLAEGHVDGRFFYDADCTGFNFNRASAPLDQLIKKLVEQSQVDDPMSMYMGSTLIDKWLPGFRAENDLQIGLPPSLVSIWIGNRSRVSAHFDFPKNIACVVAGKRKFTLFPPDQLENLYVGPLDHNPSGQAISMVDIKHPDLDRFPKYREAQKAAIEIELQPGDAVFIPSMWWHHVEAMSDFNVLVNYWWSESPAYMTSPAAVLKHALLEIKDLPDEQRAHWQRLFNYYVFEANDENFSHIPEAAKGILGDLNDTKARQLRAEILNMLNQ